MSIEVTCANGHRLRLKDKYAGKSGLCPHCHVRIAVPLRNEDVLEILGEWEPPPTPPAPEPSPAAEDDDVLTHSTPDAQRDSGVSLLGSSIIRHNKVCTQCHQLVPHWFATCSRCGAAFKDFEVGQSQRK